MKMKPIKKKENQSEKLQVYITPTLKAEVERVAGEQGLKISEFVSGVLEQYLHFKG